MRLSRRTKRRLIVVAVATGVLVGGLGGWHLARKMQVRRLTAAARVDGMAAYRNGDYGTALTKLSYYLAHQQDDLEALLAFAETRAQIPDVNNQHLVSAIGLYRAALQLDPQNREVLGQLLELYRRTGWRAETTDMADRLLALDPRHVDALRAKSVALFQQGRLEEALTLVERLIEVEPESLKWRAPALEIRRAQGAPPEQLVALCDTWIGEYEGDGRFHLLKAGILLSLGLIEEAREAARLGAERGARSLDVLQEMVNLLDRLQLRDEARQVVERARATFPDQQLVAEIVIRRFWQVGRVREAAAELDRLDADRLGIELLRWKVLLEIAQNDDQAVEDALATLTDAAAGASPAQRIAVPAWAEAVRASYRLDPSSWLATTKACQKAIALEPQDAVLYHLIGKAYAFVDEHELAAVSFERAARLDPHWISPRLALARLLVSAGRPQESLTVSAALCRQWPEAGIEAYGVLATAWMASDPSVLLPGLLARESGQQLDLITLVESLRDMTDGARFTGLLVRACVAAGRPDRARAVVAETLARRDVSIATLFLLADASAASKLGVEESLLQRAEEIAGPTPEVMVARAELLRRQGRIPEALALIDSFLAIGHEAPAARRMRALLLARSGHRDAPAALAELLAEQPSSLKTAMLVLAEPVAWRRPALITRAIDAIEDVVGPQAPRARLARASYVLQFESNDAARLAAATGEVGKVLRRTPDSLAAVTLMSRLLLAGDAPDPIRAVTYLRRAVDRYPGEVALYPRLITLLQEQGDYESAELYLGRFRERADVPSGLRRVEVGLLAAQGDFDTAMLRLGAIVDGSSPESEQLALASLSLRVGDYEQAEGIYTRLLADPARGERTLEAAVAFYANAGRLDEALRLLDASSGDLTPGKRALLWARFHQEHGDLDEAVRWLQEAVAADPENAEPWIRLTRHWLAVGKPQEARRTALAGLDVRPDDAVLRTAVAVTELTPGPALSSLALDVLSVPDPDDAALQATLALQARVTDDDGNLAPKQRDLTEARGLVNDHPLFRPAWHLAVLMYAAAGEPDEAVRLTTRAASHFPGDPDPIKWAVRLLVEQRRLEDALETAHTWRRRSLSDTLPADLLIASLLLDLREPSAAVERLMPHADRLWAERDRFPDHLATWLGALLLDRRFETAAAIARPLISADERWQAKWVELAATADPDITAETIRLVEPLVTTEAAMLSVANHWLQLARRSGDDAHFQRAEAMALRAGEVGDVTAASLHLRGAIAAARGDLVAGESIYRSILARQSQDVLALNNLAYALVRQGKRCEEAAALSARAVALAPGNPDILDTHARALVCRGNLVEAETAARRACSIRTGDPGVVLTLARILMAQTRFADADRELSRAESLLRKTGRLQGELREEAKEMRERLGEQEPLPVR